jgi:nitrile hydratase
MGCFNVRFLSFEVIFHFRCRLQAQIEAGNIKEEDLVELFGIDVEVQTGEGFVVGDFVKVKEETMKNRWRKPHLRTPGYLFGVVGQVADIAGRFGNPEFLAFNRPAGKMTLYRVRFQQKHLWEGYGDFNRDSVEVDVYHSWLEKSSQAAFNSQKLSRKVIKIESEADCNHGHSHGHGHGHGGHHHDEEDDHQHEAREVVEQRAIDLEGDERPATQFAKAVIQIMLDKGLFTAEELTKAVSAFENLGTNLQGARLVARAWTDPQFKERLLKDANNAAAEIGIGASNSHTATKLVVVENTDSVHNLVVCTLCSCYPLAILGPSPAWYKSRSYRARAVRDPRKLLKEEFGVNLPDRIEEVRVVDSTADLRYMVLPERPAGIENLSEEELIKLVTRDSMIGTARLSI